MTRILTLTISILLCQLNLPAQDGDNGHRHEKNEVALVPGLVYDFSGEQLALSAHGHYLRNTGLAGERFSLGIDMEFVGGAESHFAAGPVFAINPAWNLIFLYSPGITFKSMDGERERYFSNHMELVAEFELGNSMHIGPSAGFNLASGDRHISVGLHAGLEF